jgi:hypothetical protein
VTSRHAERSDRSPLHDVRQHARVDSRLSTDHKSRAREFRILTNELLQLAAAAAIATDWRNHLAQPSGGARRDRTDDLLLAKQALSQLSYGPDQRTDDGRRRTDKAYFRRLPSVFRRLILVGLGRFELPTSRLSSARSNQLSYKPGFGRRTTDNRGQIFASSVVRYLSSVVCPELLVREEREMKTAVSRNRHFDLAIDLP